MVWAQLAHSASERRDRDAQYPRGRALMNVDRLSVMAMLAALGFVVVRETLGFLLPQRTAQH